MTNPISHLNQFPITFRKQGTSRPASGCAVGRKGKQLLITYRIDSGETRTRWFPPHRYTLQDHDDVSILPVWKNKTCKGTNYAEPVELGEWRETHPGRKTYHRFQGVETERQHGYLCPKCKREHDIEHDDIYVAADREDSKAVERYIAVDEDGSLRNVWHGADGAETRWVKLVKRVSRIRSRKLPDVLVD